MSIPQLVVLGALAVLYAAGARCTRAWPRVRSALFLAGIGVLVVALASPLDARADTRLSDHMAQHLLLVLVAPPLLLGGAPVSLALRSLHGASRRRLARWLRSTPVRLVTHPLVALGVLSVALVVLHGPWAVDLALRAPLVHDAEHAVLFWSAMAFWTPVVGAEPLAARPGPVARIGLLLGTVPAMGAVGAWLAASTTPLYAGYAAPARALGLSPVAEQHDAAGIMWVAGMAVVVAGVVATAWRALAEEERQAQSREAHHRGPRPAGSPR